jgi:hypothetical protein
LGRFGAGEALSSFSGRGRLVAGMGGVSEALAVLDEGAVDCRGVGVEATMVSFSAAEEMLGRCNTFFVVILMDEVRGSAAGRGGCAGSGGSGTFGLVLKDVLNETSNCIPVSTCLGHERDFNNLLGQLVAGQVAQPSIPWAGLM